METPFLVFLFLIPLLILLFARAKLSSGSSKLPPSPPGLPLIGNLHQLGTHPHRSFRDLSAKYGPLMLLRLGRAPTLVVSSPDMVKDIIKNHDVAFSSRPKTTSADILLYGCQDVGFAPYGDYWRQARKICVLELLSLKRVQLYQLVRDDEAAMLVNQIRKAVVHGFPINMSAMLATASNNVLSRCVLGKSFVEEDGLSKFGELAKKFMVSMTAFSVGDFFPSLGWVDNLTGLKGRLRGLFKELDTFFDEVMDEHKAAVMAGGDYSGSSEGTKHFVEIFLRLQKLGNLDYEFTYDNMKAILVDMFIGGSDTTSTTLEWMMAELLRNPTTMKKVQEEIRRVVGNKSKIEIDDINRMDYLKCVISETLRLHPPVALLVPRETIASVELGGFHIPAKTRVFINAWAIQRDPKVWDNPEEFIPERFDQSSVDFKGQDFEFIPFGSGRRGCPGIAFGMASTEYMIANVLYWFDWELPNALSPQELDMSEVYGLTVQKKVPLNLVPKPYYP